MKIFRDLTFLPDFQQTIITVGSFDGVHHGHQMILNQMLEIASEKSLIPILITFDPHPQEILFPETTVRMLNSIEEKIELLKNIGIPNLVIIPFNQSFANITAEDYIQEFLIKYFHPSVILLGHDHHFGKNRKGNLDLLKLMANEHGYEVKQIPAYLIEEMAVSSSRIRKLVQMGHISEANNLLGYQYQLDGIVVHGNQIGRTIQFPTANIQINSINKLIPANGVYSVLAKINGSDVVYKGMMNIGLRPTIEGKEITIEVHLFDFNEDIYDRAITINLIDYIRSEVKFDGLHSLKIQLESDLLKALQQLKEY